MELLEFSFGNLDSFVIAQSKARSCQLAASLGITCPKTTVLTDGFGLAETGTTFPVVVKTDDAWGGLGVRVVNDRSALRRRSSGTVVTLQLARET